MTSDPALYDFPGRHERARTLKNFRRRTTLKRWKTAFAKRGGAGSDPEK